MQTRDQLYFSATCPFDNGLSFPIPNSRFCFYFKTQTFETSRILDDVQVQFGPFSQFCVSTKDYAKVFFTENNCITITGRLSGFFAESETAKAVVDFLESEGYHPLYEESYPQTQIIHKGDGFQASKISITQVPSVKQQHSLPIVRIHTAIEDEFHSTISVLEKEFQVTFEVNSNPPYAYATIKSQTTFKLVVSLNGGNARQGSHHTYDGLKLLADITPNIVIMCGICAGNPKRTKYGDVILFNTVINYEKGSKEVDQIRGDADRIEINQSLKNVMIMCKSFLKSKDIDLLTGCALSGESVRHDFNEGSWATYEKVLASKKVFALDCESYAFMNYHKQQIPCFVLKSVQDFADMNKADASLKNRNISCVNSILSLALLLKKGIFDSYL